MLFLRKPDMVESINMKTADVQALPAPPSLIGSLLAGFNATANHIDLVLLPIFLDLFLWFGPHLRLARLVDGLLSNAASQSGVLGMESTDLLQAGGKFWASVTERLNLFSSIRSYPVGVPSLMASSQPLNTPIGKPVFMDTGSIGLVILFWIFISILGLAIGTLYFSIVSQAAVSGQVSWRSAFSAWRWEVPQVLLLALLWTGIIVAIFVPASCLLSTIVFAGLPFADMALFIYAGLVLWILFPLFFSPFGIFLYQRKMSDSVKDSMRVTRMTMPRSLLFLLIILLVDEGFTILWQVPEDVSWLAVIGIIGHAFIATGLVAACFIYYRDASRWSQRLIQQAALSPRA